MNACIMKKLAIFIERLIVFCVDYRTGQTNVHEI